MKSKAEHENQQYGIGAVAKLTGLTDHTIRVWERRYKAVVAQRTPTGRRNYTPADVEKLGFLKRLTDQGFSISQIANNTIDDLRKHVQSIGDLASGSLPGSIGIAVLGDYVTGQITRHERDIAPIEVLVAETNPENFTADLQCQKVNVIVFESPVLDSDTVPKMLDYLANARCSRGVFIYSFGKASDIEMAQNHGIVLLRGPVSVEEIQAAVVRTYSQAGVSKPRKQTPEQPGTLAWDAPGPIAPRRFSQQQLATLANASTAIDCECPHHLARLVGDLSSFEIYSANCANRDEDDAALHQYLHRTTAAARALVEVALAKVADAEGINY